MGLADELKAIFSLGKYFVLTHCGLVMPYGIIDHGQHWLRQWLGACQHQAIAWTNVDLSKDKNMSKFKSVLLDGLYQDSCRCSGDHDGFCICMIPLPEGFMLIEKMCKI